MDGVRLAGGPVSWGVDFAGPGNPPWGEVLDGIAAAGLEWLELGPVGFLPREPHVAAAALARRGLAAVGTFVFADFHRPAAAAEVLEATDAALDAIVGAGGTLAVLIDRPSDARAATAGRRDRARRLDGTAWTGMVDVFRRAAERASARGLRAVVHPHTGSYVEFDDEVERLLGAIDAGELGLCLDTGHALYAGADPAQLIRRYAQRLEHLHLKDVASETLGRRLGFWDAVAAGVFCPIGNGILDLAAVRDALGAAGYAGFATLEQDRRESTAGSPAADLRRSVDRVRFAGIG
jgi:inosose dehydratase